MKKYYTLAGIEKDGIESFQILFGDYHRDVVEDEMQEYKEQGEYKKLRIVSSGDSQSDIENRVQQLNEGV